MTEQEATQDFNRWLEEADREASKPNPNVVYLQTQAQIKGFHWTKEQKEFAEYHLLSMTSRFKNTKIEPITPRPKKTFFEKVKMAYRHTKIIMSGKGEAQDDEDEFEDEE